MIAGFLVRSYKIYLHIYVNGLGIKLLIKYTTNTIPHFTNKIKINQPERERWETDTERGVIPESKIS